MINTLIAEYNIRYKNLINEIYSKKDNTIINPSFTPEIFYYTTETINVSIFDKVQNNCICSFTDKLVYLDRIEKKLKTLKGGFKIDLKFNKVINKPIHYIFVQVKDGFFDICVKNGKAKDYFLLYKGVNGYIKEKKFVPITVYDELIERFNKLKEGL